MDLQAISVFVIVLTVVVLIVAFSFRAGKGSVVGELEETRVALGFYKEFARIQRVGDARQASEFADSVVKAKERMSRKEYDVLVMRALNLAEQLKASISIHSIR